MRKSIFFFSTASFLLCPYFSHFNLKKKRKSRGNDRISWLTPTGENRVILGFIQIIRWFDSSTFYYPGRWKERRSRFLGLPLVIAETIKPYMIIIVLDGKNQKEEGNWFHGGISSENTKKRKTQQTMSVRKMFRQKIKNMKDSFLFPLFIFSRCYWCPGGVTQGELKKTIYIYIRPAIEPLFRRLQSLLQKSPFPHKLRVFFQKR
jgi:hypothetical protein